MCVLLISCRHYFECEQGRLNGMRLREWKAVYGSVDLCAKRSGNNGTGIASSCRLQELGARNKRYGNGPGFYEITVQPKRQLTVRRNLVRRAVNVMNVLEVRYGRRN